MDSFLQVVVKRLVLTMGLQRWGLIGCIYNKIWGNPQQSAPAVGPQATPLVEHLPTLRITPPWGMGDPLISVTGMLPRPLGKT